MKYANEALILWYMACATFIVITNPEAHTEFILINVGVFALYKWLQEREGRHGDHKQVSSE